MQTKARQRLSLLFLAIGVEGTLGVLAWVLGCLLGPDPWQDWRWDGRHAALGVAGSGPLVAVLVLLLRWPIGPLRRIERISRRLFGPLFAPCSVAELALIAGMAGIGEEMFFRGFLQGFLAEHLGAWWALALASALFGILHTITPAYALMAAVMGAYLGWLLMITGDLLVPVIAHAVYDLAALVVLTRTFQSADDHL